MGNEKDVTKLVVIGTLRGIATKFEKLAKDTSIDTSVKKCLQDDLMRTKLVFRLVRGCYLSRKKTLR